MENTRINKRGVDRIVNCVSVAQHQLNSFLVILSVKQILTCYFQFFLWPMFVSSVVQYYLVSLELLLQFM